MYLANKEIEIGEKNVKQGLLRRSRSFKVIQGHPGRYQSKARTGMRLPTSISD